MTSPGTPQIQNIIQANTLGTNPMSGAVVGIIAGVFMFVVGMFWLTAMIKKDIANGGKYEALEGEVVVTKREDELPSPMASFIPFIATIVFLNVLKFKVEIAIVSSILVGFICLHKNINMKDLTGMFTRGSAGAISAIANTCAVVGFGSVVRSVPAFQPMVDMVTNLPGPPLAGAAIAVTVICGITGSASGGLGISIPIIGPIYLAMGVVPGALHRVAAIASGALDSLPHNGYVVTTLNICKANHKTAYMPIFWLTVVLPAIATVFAIVLFQFFPNWP
jgi:H+/gluconate symporter-like permease